MNDESRIKRIITRRSAATFFVIGAILLLGPILMILLVSSGYCSSFPASVCLGSSFLRLGISFAPYIMLVGGVIIAYNMKRISDSLLPETDSYDDIVE